LFIPLLFALMLARSSPVVTATVEETMPTSVTVVARVAHPGIERAAEFRIRTANVVVVE
jgi:hypothetical protein